MQSYLHFCRIKHFIWLNFLQILSKSLIWQWWMMCSYFTRYFHDFKTHRAPGKENLNIIKDTADFYYSGKVCSHPKTHRNNFAVVNCHLTKEINFFRALALCHIWFSVSHMKPSSLVGGSYYSGYNLVHCKQTNLFEDMLRGHDEKTNYFTQALCSPAWLPDENWLAPEYLEKYVTHFVTVCIWLYRLISTPPLSS